MARNEILKVITHYIVRGDEYIVAKGNFYKMGGDEMFDEHYVAIPRTMVVNGELNNYTMAQIHLSASAKGAIEQVNFEYEAKDWFEAHPDASDLDYFRWALKRRGLI